MMRIITGRARGVHLRTLEGENTRPTIERVKESVFSMLQFELEGRLVLDLFSGSGQMGLEAVSRGAAKAVLVDSSKDAVRIIQENAQKTGLAELCQIVRSDAIDYLQRSRERFDIVFLDPPYASELYALVLRALIERRLLKPTSIVVFESDREDVLEADPVLLERFSIRKATRYGKVVLTLLEPTADQE